MSDLRKLVKDTLAQHVEGMMSEAFFYRTQDPLENLIQSFKNLFLNLKYAMDERHRLEFFSSNVKKDLETYRDHILFYYNKDSKKEFVTKFKGLIDEIDFDLISDLGIDKFIHEILAIFEDKKALDRANIKIEKTFEKFIGSIDKNVVKLFANFQKKLEDNEFYEPLKNIHISTSGVTLEEFFKQRYLLQIELLKLEEWIRANGKKLLIIFEGRDAAGKGSTIKMFTENMDPKSFRVETFGIPTEHDKENWFDRYEAKMPGEGEIVFFDRSWYNRAYLEPVMEYCTKEQYKKFMSSVNGFEQKLDDDNVIVMKLWFSVSKDTQKLRFELRKSNPLRYWKYSANDASTIDRWDEFTKYVNKMFKHTNTKVCPWVVIDSNDDRHSKLTAIKKVLGKFNYDEKDKDVLTESKKNNSDKFIFLDIDGVLMPFSSADAVTHKDFEVDKDWCKESIKNVNELVKRTSGKVVIISNYIRLKTQSQIKSQFKKVGLDFEIHGFIHEVLIEKRGQEIKDYIEANGIKNFVVIDDQTHDFEKIFKSGVVKPKTDIGFTKKNMTSAIEVLTEKNGVLKESTLDFILKILDEETKRIKKKKKEYPVAMPMLRRPMGSIFSMDAGVSMSESDMLNEDSAMKVITKKFDHLKWPLNDFQKQFLDDFISMPDENLRDQDFEYASRRTGIPLASLKSIKNTHAEKKTPDQMKMENNKIQKELGLGGGMLDQGTIYTANADFVGARDLPINKNGKTWSTNPNPEFRNKSLHQQDYESNIAAMTGGGMTKKHERELPNFMYEWLMYFIEGSSKFKITESKTMNDFHSTKFDKYKFILFSVDSLVKESGAHPYDIASNTRVTETQEVEEKLKEFNSMFGTNFIVSNQYTGTDGMLKIVLENAQTTDGQMVYNRQFTDMNDNDIIKAIKLGFYDQDSTTRSITG